MPTPGEDPVHPWRAPKPDTGKLVTDKLTAAIDALIKDHDVPNAAILIAQAGNISPDPGIQDETKKLSGDVLSISGETSHATMSEYARRLQDSGRIQRGEAWGHYAGQTRAALEWCHARGACGVNWATTPTGKRAYGILEWVSADPAGRISKGIAQMDELARNETRPAALNEIRDAGTILARLQGGTADTISSQAGPG